MHELPVVMDIVRVIGEEANKRNLKEIIQIDLVVGELSSVMDESVQMYFEIIAKNSVCAGAKLVFEHRPAMLKCSVCGKEFAHTHNFSCPVCDGESMLVQGTGNEFYIRSFTGQ
jgi:hydrogenase nickel incorporation protein HypA/HybF